MRWSSPGSGCSGTRQRVLSRTAVLRSAADCPSRVPAPAANRSTQLLSQPRAALRCRKRLAVRDPRRLQWRASPPTELDYRPSYRAAAIASGLVLAALPRHARARRPRCGTRASTSPRRTRSACRTRRATRSSSSSAASSRCCRSREPSRCASTCWRRVCSAVSAGMWFLITERVLVELVPASAGSASLGGALAALIGATAFTVWNQSVVNEKVYTVSLVGIAIISWLTVRWCDDPDGRKADRILVLIAYLLGLGYANHMAGMLAAPAVGDRGAHRRPAHAAALAAAARLRRRAAARLHAVRDAADPRRATSRAINEGEPTACRTELDLRLHVQQGDVRRVHVQLQPRAVRQAASSPSGRRRSRAQVGMWWLYFKWQWLRDAHGEQPVAAGASSPRSSSCSACSAAGSTTSETDEVSGTSGR